MPLLIVTTSIRAPADRCFDLARSIDLHQDSMKSTGERAVAGVTTGLINLNESVTWQARHFGLKLRLTSRITAFNRPTLFRDEQVSGPFARFIHDHIFDESSPGTTLMTDRFDFTSPLGLLGKLADRLFLARKMRLLLADRGAAIRRIAESDDWRKYLPASAST